MQSERDILQGRLEECQAQLQRQFHKNEKSDLEKEDLILSIEKLQAVNVGCKGEATELKRQLEHHISANVRLERCLSKLPAGTEVHNPIVDSYDVSNPSSNQLQHQELKDRRQSSLPVKKTSGFSSQDFCMSSRTRSVKRTSSKSSKDVENSKQLAQPDEGERENPSEQGKLLEHGRTRDMMHQNKRDFDQGGCINASVQVSHCLGDWPQGTSSFVEHTSEVPQSKALEKADELEKETVLSDSAVPRPICDGKKGNLQCQLKELHNSFRTLRSKFK